jgi:hypothetical protein
MLNDPKPRNDAHPINWRKGCLSLLLAYVGLPIVFITSFKISYEILERPIINSLYGPNAYANGLHAHGKHGQLSDHSGRRLPAGWFAVLAIGSFLLSMLPLICYVTVISAFGLFPPEGVFRKE